MQNGEITRFMVWRKLDININKDEMLMLVFGLQYGTACKTATDSGR